MHATYCTALCFVSLGALASSIKAQSKQAIPPSEANFFIGTPAGWTQPETPWGDPDIQGIWPLNNVGATPLQRCMSRQRYPGAAPDKIAACDPNKLFLTEAEFKTLQENASRMPDRYADAARNGEAGRALVTGIVDAMTPQRQTSLISDPPDGKLPEMTPEGKRLAAEMKSTWPLPGETLVFDSHHDFDLWDRCITRGMPVSMFPFRYN